MCVSRDSSARSVSSFADFWRFAKIWSSSSCQAMEASWAQPQCHEWSNCWLVNYPLFIITSACTGLCGLQDMITLIITLLSGLLSLSLTECCITFAAIISYNMFFCRIFVCDLLNFSFWSDSPELSTQNKFMVDYKGTKWTGYWAWCACLNRALEVSNFHWLWQ